MPPSAAAAPQHTPSADAASRRRLPLHRRRHQTHRHCRHRRGHRRHRLERRHAGCAGPAAAVPPSAAPAPQHTPSADAASDRPHWHRRSRPRGQRRIPSHRHHRRRYQPCRRCRPGAARSCRGAPVAATAWLPRMRPYALAVAGGLCWEPTAALPPPARKGTWRLGNRAPAASADRQAPGVAPQPWLAEDAAAAAAAAAAAVAAAAASARARGASAPRSRHACSSLPTGPGVQRQRIDRGQTADCRRVRETACRTARAGWLAARLVVSRLRTAAQGRAPGRAGPCPGCAPPGTVAPPGPAQSPPRRQSFAGDAGFRPSRTGSAAACTASAPRPER